MRQNYEAITLPVFYDYGDKFGTSFLCLFSPGDFYGSQRKKRKWLIEFTFEQVSLLNLFTTILFLLHFLPSLGKKNVNAYIKMGVCIRFCFFFTLRNQNGKTGELVIRELSPNEALILQMRKLKHSNKKQLESHKS